MSDYTITLDWPATDVLAYAIQRTMDDLEARAIVAEHHDPELGPTSARDYRADIARLRSVLGQISPDIRLPDPEQAAVRWIDGTYTVVDGQPVPMLAQPELREVLEATTALRGAGLLPGDQALDLLASAIERGTPERTIPAPERTMGQTSRAPGHEIIRDIEPPAAP